MRFILAAALVIVLALLGVLPIWASGYILGVLTVAYYFSVFAMAWDLLFGFANEVNFGPTFLIGLGAYGAGILNGHGLPIWACVVLGTLIAIIGGIGLALPALRLTGPYFGLTTLVAVLILQNLIVVFAGFTGGEIGLMVPDVISIDAGTNYWIAFGFMVVSGAILWALSRSPIGLILQASGQDAVQAGALGFNITKHKLAAFIISAFFSGLSGSLLVFYMGTASVSTLVSITVGVQIIIAAVIGGRRTIIGAAIGTIFLIAMTEALRSTGGAATFIVSAMALVVAIIAAVIGGRRTIIGAAIGTTFLIGPIFLIAMTEALRSTVGVATFIVSATALVVAISAAVIGGRRTIRAAIGTIFLIAMTQALKPTGELATFIVSAMALVVVLVAPNGFMGVLTGRRGERA